MNRMVKRYVGRRDIIDGSGKVIASIERNPYGTGYRHITDDGSGPHMFLNLGEVRDYYSIRKGGEV